MVTSRAPRLKCAVPRGVTFTDRGTPDGTTEAAGVRGDDPEGTPGGGPQGRGGRELVDHAPGGHDDLANAVAGALVGVGLGRRGTMQIGSFSLTCGSGVALDFADWRCGTCWECRHGTGRPCLVSAAD